MLNGKPLVAEENNGSDDHFWKNLTEGELIDIDLLTACAIGDFDYVKSSIDNEKSGTDIVNRSNRSGWTPLMYVCYVGNEKIAELLIHEGAEVLYEENVRGRTPLMVAAGSGNVSLVKRLVENDARINRADNFGQTALFYAAEHGQTSVVKYLLSLDADISIRQHGTGYTAFMEVAKQGHEGIFSAFLEHGIDLGLVCNKGYTARNIAKQCGFNVIVNLIDNHCYKFPSLRYDADLSDFCIVAMEGNEKVHGWIQDNNFNHSYDDPANKSSRSQSEAISIDTGLRPYPVGESFARSAGDSTIVDSDKTPVGTPVDSIFHQYMAQRRYDVPYLHTFLQDLGYEKYIKLFEDNKVDFSILLCLSEDDLKELGIVIGVRRKLIMAIEKWKKDTEWPQDGLLSLELTDVYVKLQHVTTELMHEKEARSVLEAEQMEGRARRSHMHFVGQRVLRACKELQNTNKTLIKHVESLKKLSSEANENLVSRLKELHKQMSEDILNADNTTETILRRVEKLISDEVMELSSGSDSPESSCTSFSKSESGSGVIVL